MALHVLLMARRAAECVESGRTALIRSLRWSKLNGPLMWAAADGDDHHPVLEWLERAAQGCQLTVAAMSAEPMPGPTAVREAWLALATGMRMLGITSRQQLCEWHVRNGYGRLSNGGYLTALAQVAIHTEAHAALHGVADIAPPALEDVYVGLVQHLAGR
eukprot:3256781-Karenia_brevis.AAC.1